MVKKKNNLIIYFVLFLLSSIVIGSIYKFVKSHHDKEYYVVYSRIKESAKECYLKGDCQGDIILKDLYDKGYIETQFDPITKEDLNQNICLTFKENVVEFCK